jgi:hypothetical protein
VKINNQGNTLFKLTAITLTLSGHSAFGGKVGRGEGTNLQNFSSNKMRLKVYQCATAWNKQCNDNNAALLLRNSGPPLDITILCFLLAFNSIIERIPFDRLAPGFDDQRA